MLSLRERFGMYDNAPVECLDDSNLFIKSGVTVVASLAGEGKTTFIQAKCSEWEKDGYEINHINFDNAPTYGKDMINCPVSDSEFDDFFEILENEADEKTILIIDSLKAMCSYMSIDIDSNVEVYPVMQKFRRLCKKTGINIIIIHHSFKSKSVKSILPQFYGSRAIEEQCDSGFIYSKDAIRIVKNRAGYAREDIVDLTVSVKPFDSKTEK